MRKTMKGLCLILASLILMVLASTPALAGVNYGFKGGITLANIKSVPETFEGYKWENKMGLAGGIFLEIGLPGPFSIQPEVLYVQKGAKISFAEGEFSGTLSANVDYIELLNNDQVAANSFNFSGDAGVQAFYHRDHADDSHNSDDNAQSGQERAHFVRFDRIK